MEPLPFSVCACCVPGVLIGVLLTAWIVFSSTALFINAVSKKGSNLRYGLNAVAYLLTGVMLLIAIALGVLQVSADSRAMLFAKICSGMVNEPKMSEFRCNHLGSGVHGRVLEIGPGPGTNFKCWSPTVGEDGIGGGDGGITEWVGVEPNNHFEPFITKEKETRNITFPTSITWMQGENLAIEPESFDVVVGTHVLCSVEDVDAVLLQVARALKPGGVYYFIEHVATTELYGSMWAMQQAVAPFLNIIGNGCTFKHLGDYIHRVSATKRLLSSKSATASNGHLFDIELKRVTAPVGMPFIQPHIIGKLTKR